MEHTHNHTSGHNEEHGLFYTYFGETGAAGFAVVMFIILATCIYSFLRWG